jgi:hypothetical protein
MAEHTHHYHGEVHQHFENLPHVEKREEKEGEHKRQHPALAHAAKAAGIGYLAVDGAVSFSNNYAHAREKYKQYKEHTHPKVMAGLKKAKDFTKNVFKSKAARAAVKIAPKL